MDIPRVWAVFWRFLGLGCISFGGPAAHIGYFRTTFVEKLNWLDDKTYANLVALSQFLPGPGSSQVGFSLGLRRAGLPGAIAAFLGFTLPSFILMFILASATGEDPDSWFNGIVAGLKLLAVVVVADAVISMFRLLCKDNLTMTIAVLTAVSLWLAPTIWMQLLVLLMAALVGLLQAAPQPSGTDEPGQPAIKLNWPPLILFATLFVGLPLLAMASAWFGLFDTFFLPAVWSLVVGM